MISLFPERGAPVLFEAELDSTNTRLKAMAAYAERAPSLPGRAADRPRGQARQELRFPVGRHISLDAARPRCGHARLPDADTHRPPSQCGARSRRSAGWARDIKWPNDLQFGGKKLCGILTESVTAGGSFKLIIGIGVNLNTGMDELPLELHDTACSVYSVTGRYTPQEAVIRAIVDELDSAYAHWVVNSHWALDDYRAACASLGHRVQRGSVCGEARRDHRRFRPAHPHGRGRAHPRLQRRDIVRIAKYNALAKSPVCQCVFYKLCRFFGGSAC